MRNKEREKERGRGGKGRLKIKENDKKTEKQRKGQRDTLERSILSVHSMGGLDLG